MTKVAYSDRNIKSFGGLHFIFGALSTYGIDKQIDAVLGDRGPLCKYSYSNALLGFFSAFLAGGNCLEDLHKLRSEAADVKGSSICSADTLTRIINDLSCKGIQVPNSNGGINTLVDNDLLNKLLVQMAVFNLKSELEPTVDIDAHILECDKKDACYAYNNKKGYAPLVGFINRIPVRVQNRSGNTSPAYGHVEFVEALLKDLADEGIKVKNFRADAASYNLDLLNLLDRFKTRFYVRAPNSSTLLEAVRKTDENKWKMISYENKPTLEVADIEFNGYRIAVQRTRKESDQIDIFDNYTYRAIITNDRRACMNGADVTMFYNDRGDSEKNFDILQNDFGWAKLPLDNIADNTTYLLLTAFFMSLFEWLKSKLGSAKEIIYQGMRTKAFLLHFLSIPAKVAYRSRQRIITFFTQIRFGQLEELLI